MGEKEIDVFISYSWEDDEHNEWVRSLADQLLENGINAILDKYDLSPGDRLPHFMEKHVTSADYVLIICTPIYKKKSDSREGGVGYEEHIITGELLSKGNEKKYIPILRKGNVKNAVPVCMSGKWAIDLRDGKHYKDNFDDLLTTLYGISKKPKVNKVALPSGTIRKQSLAEDNEPIYISGIITDQVTIPTMDGTQGSALYKIPFKLSRKPSSTWKKIFLEAWNSPPKFSLMHRPGIASVLEDKIILDGTTIEEVRDYHRETLMLCVDIANKKECAVLEAEKQKKEKEEQNRNNHFNNVNDIANTIKF